MKMFMVHLGSFPLGDSRLLRLMAGPLSWVFGRTWPRIFLNPRFVERLMGLPVAWTNSGCSATELSRYKRRMRSALSRLVQGCCNDG